MDEKNYIESYMEYNGLCFMVCQVLHQAHLKEVGLT
jgi:hypothetical protein